MICILCVERCNAYRWNEDWNIFSTVCVTFFYVKYTDHKFWICRKNSAHLKTTVILLALVHKLGLIMKQNSSILIQTGWILYLCLWVFTHRGFSFGKILGNNSTQPSVILYPGPCIPNFVLIHWSSRVVFKATSVVY